jgi:hypothetical protein
VYRRKFGYSDTDPLVSKDFAAKRQAQWEKMRTPRTRATGFKRDSEHFWHEVDRLAELLEEWGLTRSDKTERGIKQSLEKLGYVKGGLTFIGSIAPLSNVRVKPAVRSD